MLAYVTWLSSKFKIGALLGKRKVQARDKKQIS